ASSTGVPAECARESLSRPAPGPCRHIGPVPGRTCPRVGRPVCAGWPGAGRTGPGAGRGRGLAAGGGAARGGRGPGTAREGGRYAAAGGGGLPVTADDDLARVLAAEAGRRLLARRARGGDAGDLRAAGDRLSHEFLASELGRLRPGDAVLSEEARDDPARL